MTAVEKPTDVHLHFIEDELNGLVFDFEGSLIFPGPASPHANHRPLFDILVNKLIGIDKNSIFNRDKSSFWIRIHEPYSAVFRVERSTNAVDGAWFRLRRTMQELPSLDALLARIPDQITQKMLSPELKDGGLVLVCGPPGAGKTTTASAFIASRLVKFGGMAWTVEDPPEILSLNGWHGKGYCTQTEVLHGDEGWSASIRSLLRSQPVSSTLILFVGEIRTSQAAQMIVRAASNGFLVITTSFATDIINGIESIAQMAGDDHIDYLASVLRGCLYQKLTLGPTPMLQTQFLYSPTSTSRVAQLIRARHFRQLKDELIFQNQPGS